MNCCDFPKPENMFPKIIKKKKEHQILQKSASLAYVLKTCLLFGCDTFSIVADDVVNDDEPDRN